MRFIIIHKTNPHWEAGASPSPELIARVGALIDELAAAKVFHGGQGLRSSAEGVRLTISGGTRTVTKGPFAKGNELPAGFTILRTGSIEEAVDWASNAAPLQGATEIDIRPVTEPWDIGMAPRPEHVITRRYMALRKATAASEAGEPIPPSRRAGLARLIEESRRTGVHLATETMQPSARGRRYKHSHEGVAMTDGPFTETKELIAGYVIVSANSLDEVGTWAERYLTVVGADEVDVRALEDP